MPAAAITSASPSLAQVMPIAPASISRCAICGTLMPLVCGRQLMPCCRQVPAMRAMFSSSASRSTSSAGVSSARLSALQVLRKIKTCIRVHGRSVLMSAHLFVGARDASAPRGGSTRWRRRSRDSRAAPRSRRRTGPRSSGCRAGDTRRRPRDHRGCCAGAAGRSAPARGPTSPRCRRSNSPGSPAARRRAALSAAAVAKMSRLAKAMCCTPAPKNSDRNFEDCVRDRLRAIQDDAQAAVVGLDHLAAHHAARIDDVLLGDFLQIEQRGVEQQPAQHLLVAHRLRDVIDRGQARAVACRNRNRVEIDLPELAERRHVRRRNSTRLPPRPRTAGMSSSPGPTAWRNGRSSSRCARSSVAVASLTRSAIAHTAVPCVMLKECAKPSVSVLTTRLMSPCCQRATFFVLCWPVWRKPSPPAASRSRARSSRRWRTR